MIADDILRQRITAMFPAPPTTGVADAVRARVAAGDLGAPPPPSGGAFLSWVPWIAGALVVGAVALGLGATGALRPSSAVASDDGPTVSFTQATSALDCPSGSPVALLAGGTRVLAIQRSDDSAWLGVRNPANLVQVLWVQAESVEADTGGDLARLPVGGCTVGAIESSPTIPTPTQAPAEPNAPAPAAPVDSAAPTISATSVAYSPATGYVCSEQPASHATIAITVADNVGVVGVSSTGGYAGSAMGSGATWTIDYYPTGLSVTAPVSITITARDAAGNSSAPVTVTVNRDQCPG